MKVAKRILYLMLLAALVVYKRPSVYTRVSAACDAFPVESSLDK